MLAVVLITLYFNIYTKDSRIFEPQKALILRSLVTFMLAVWAVRTLEENRLRLQQAGWWGRALTGAALFSTVAAVASFVLGLATWQDPLGGMAGATPPAVALRIFQGIVGAGGTFLMVFAAGLALVGAGYALRDSWKRALTTVMVIPALAYIAVHILSTIASVFPQASLYGGYVRQQGTLSVLAYIGLFFILAFNLRRREQLERLITVILVTSLPSALYGIVQKFGIDPLPWMGNVEARVASTMGNAIFIAAYLIMVLPLIGYRVLSTWDRLKQSPPVDETPPGGNGILRPLYPRLLWGGVGFILALAFTIMPIVLATNVAAMRKNPAVTAEEIALVWPAYGQNLLLFLGVAVLTLALPTLVYSLWSLIGERWRPYAHLAGVGVLLLEAGLVMFVPTVLTPGSNVQAFLDSMRVNGFFWAGYLLALFALALLSRWQHARRPWGSDALRVDMVFILLVLQSVLLFVVIQAYLPSSPYPTKWPLYLIALVGFFASCFLITRGRTAGRLGYLAQLGAYLILGFLQLVCIFLTQSRGPLLGLLVSVFAFAVLWPLRRRMRTALIVILVVAVLGGVFLAIFNLPDTPLLGDLLMRNPQIASFVEGRLEPLKYVPYVGRLGKMFDASEGTGRVRILIWFGDEIGTGSVGMIFSNPLRTLIGFGPETMHVAYNPYYPPELAHVERRNASPDRAHNAIIDELVTMGVLGLVAYLVYFASFFVLVWQMLWKAEDLTTQALGVGLFTLGAAHFAETLFGIPIVATRMYMWIAIGIAVAMTRIGAFGAEEGVPASPEEEEVEEVVDRRRKRRAARRRRQRGIPVGWSVAYAAIALGALVFVWQANLKPMWADLLFWQSKQLEAQADAYQKQAQQITDETISQQRLSLAGQFAQESLDSLLQAIRLMPGEDFYYLSLAQIYLGNAQTGDNAQQNDLFYKSTDAAITRARDLSFLNTDHYRNFSATYMNWFQRTGQPDKLARSIAYGEQAISLTRNNADLRYRQAQAYLLAVSIGEEEVLRVAAEKGATWLQGWEQYHLTSGGRGGDTHLPLAAQYRDRALELLAEGELKRGLQVLAAAELQYSLFLDEKYASTYSLLGDLYWRLGMPREAALIYGEGIRLSPGLISDSNLEARLKFLSGAGELAPLIRAYQDVITQTRATWEARERQRGSVEAALQTRWRKTLGDTYQILGYVYIRQGNQAAAIAAYDAALAERVSFEAHKNLSILYDQAGRLEDALVHAQAALQIAEEKNQTQDIQSLQQYIQQLQQRLQQQGGP